MRTKILVAACCLVLCLSCNKFLEEEPQGVISSEELDSPENADKMVVAAYSSLGNDDGLLAYYSGMWAYGSLRSGDAYKGGDGPGDGVDNNAYEVFSLNRTDVNSTDYVWKLLYIAVGRTNDALRRVNALTDQQYPARIQRQAELRFLRGHYYFLLKLLFKYVPYLTEDIAKTEYANISNRELTDQALWSKIADDFTFAAANLPATQNERGRATKGAANAYLAKTLLYQAYTQDDQNRVTGVDAQKLTSVIAACDAVISSNNYALYADFASNFLSTNRNGTESVFAIQYSISDGTSMGGRVDFSHQLNYPMNSEYGCCGFHVPSNNLVNSFQTSTTGLPLFDTYNNRDVVPLGDYTTTDFDPRLDHTAAIPGKPYKYRPSFIYQVTWSRAPQIYGPLLSMKETVLPDDPAFKRNPPFMSSAKNWDVIRYADVLLFKAEALIELGRQDEALPLINMIRTRAQQSTSLLKKENGMPSSSYRINTYVPGVNCQWTNGYARQALRFERRLEFAMEGYRFFDLVRWGIAADYINSYLTVEKVRKPHLRDAIFKAGRDEYFPIPLNQINFSKGLYVQNTGW